MVTTEQKTSKLNGRKCMKQHWEVLNNLGTHLGNVGNLLLHKESKETNVKMAPSWQGLSLYNWSVHSQTRLFTLQLKCALPMSKLLFFFLSHNLGASISHSHTYMHLQFQLSISLIPTSHSHTLRISGGQSHMNTPHLTLYQFKCQTTVAVNATWNVIPCVQHKVF